MKHIFIIILLWPLVNFSQMPDTCFTENEIIEISETLDSLYYLDSINTEIISQQEALISELESIIILDSVEIMYINHKSKLLYLPCKHIISYCIVTSYDFNTKLTYI